MDPTATFSWTDWHLHPSILVGIAAWAAAYVLGVGPLRRRYGWAAEPEPRKGLLFGLGILVLFLALQSPLHDLGDEFLFSAHMTQHMLLTLVAAPLLLWGTPGWLLQPLLRRPGVFPTARFLTRPLIAIATFNATLLLWHLPPAYEAALDLRGVHILEHLLFLGTALLMWWPILSPVPELPRLNPPLQMLYLFVQSMLPAVLGAFITFSGSLLYPTYAAAPRVFDMTAIVDQQLGGLIMKVPGTLLLWGVVTVVFFRWAGEEQRRTEEAEAEGENEGLSK